MQVDLSSKDKVKFLVSSSHKMGLTPDEVLAVYVLLEDKIFFLFDLFQGRTIKFPSMRSFHRGLSLTGECRLLKLKKPAYLVNGSEAYKEDIRAGDCVVVDSVNFLVVGSPMVILGETYILVKENLKEE